MRLANNFVFERAVKTETKNPQILSKTSRKGIMTWQGQTYIHECRFRIDYGPQQAQPGAYKCRLR